MDENTNQTNPQPLDMTGGSNSEPSTPVDVPAGEPKSVGPVVAAIIILIVLVVAAFWVWGSRSMVEPAATGDQPVAQEEGTRPADGVVPPTVTPPATDTDPDNATTAPAEDLVGDQESLDLLQAIDEESVGLVGDDAAILDAMADDLPTAEELESGLTGIDEEVNVE